MKNKNTIIAILVAVALIAAGVVLAVTGKFAPDDKEESTSAEVVSSVTVAVTDENGEAVTDEAGEVVTEVLTNVVAVTDGKGNTVYVPAEQAATTSGSAVSQGGNESGGETSGNQPSEQSTSAPNGAASTSAQSTTAATTANTTASTTTGTTQAPITKPSRPDDVSNLRAGKITENSIELKWDKVKCDYYLVSMSNEENGEYQPIGTDNNNTKIASNNLVVTGLQPGTVYYFAVWAVNENQAGKMNSANPAKEKFETGVITVPRKINIHVIAPMKSAQEDTVTFWIKEEKGKWEEIGASPIYLDGETHTYVTEKEYSGSVVVYAKIEGLNEERQEICNGEDCTLDISAIGIVVAEGEDD